MASTSFHPPEPPHTGCVKFAGRFHPASTGHFPETRTVQHRRLDEVAALVQPLMIVAMGAIVLVLVLAIMLPIVSMNQLIR